jgi:hypothetical protein
MIPILLHSLNQYPIHFTHPINNTGAGKTALAAALTSGQSVKGQSFKATGEAGRHTLRVPVQAEGKPLVVEMTLTDLVRACRVCAYAI